MKILTNLGPASNNELYSYLQASLNTKLEEFKEKEGYVSNTLFNWHEHSNEVLPFILYNHPSPIKIWSKEK